LAQGHWLVRLTAGNLDLLKAMGSNVLVFADTSNAIHGDVNAPLSKRPVLEAAGWAEFGRRIEQVAEATLREGVRLVYHHHMGTIVQSEADIGAFMAATGPATYLLLDTGHAAWAGADSAVLALRYRNRISHVHTKDVRAVSMQRAAVENWSFLKSVVEGVFTVPGDGMVDYPAVFGALSNYSGWVVIEAEQDPAKANPLAYAKVGYANLRRYLADAGLRDAAW
jgi:inosose dehydratase